VLDAASTAISCFFHRCFFGSADLWILRPFELNGSLGWVSSSAFIHICLCIIMPAPSILPHARVMTQFAPGAWVNAHLTLCGIHTQHLINVTSITSWAQYFFTAPRILLANVKRWTASILRWPIADIKWQYWLWFYFANHCKKTQTTPRQGNTINFIVETKKPIFS